MEQSGCGCSTVDIQRMELIVMQKLEFNLVRSAPLDFLRIVSPGCTIAELMLFTLIVSHAGHH